MRAGLLPTPHVPGPAALASRRPVRVLRRKQKELEELERERKREEKVRRREQRQRDRALRRSQRKLERLQAEEQKQLHEKIRLEERKLVLSQRNLQSIRLVAELLSRAKVPAAPRAPVAVRALCPAVPPVRRWLLPEPRAGLPPGGASRVRVRGSAHSLPTRRGRLTAQACPGLPSAVQGPGSGLPVPEPRGRARHGAWARDSTPAADAWPGQPALL